MSKLITIPRDLLKERELILISREEYERLIETQKVAEEDVLRWTREAKILKRSGRLPKLKSWTDFKK